MIKHTLEISQRPVRLSLRQRQLVIKLPDDEGERTFAFAGKGPFSFIIGEFDNELALAEREPDRSLRDFEGVFGHS